MESSSWTNLVSLTRHTGTIADTSFAFPKMTFHIDHMRSWCRGIVMGRAFAVALGLACPGAAHADELTIAVESIDYPPLYNGTDSRNYRGFARELFDLFGARYQHRIRYVPLPLNRLFAEFFTAGEFDLKFPDNPNWQTGIKKGLRVDYSDPVVDVTEGVFVLRDNAGRGPAGLKAMATLTGFTPQPYSMRIKEGAIKLYFADNLDSLHKMLAIGRVDGVYASDLAMRFYESKYGVDPHAIVLDRSLPDTVSAFRVSSLKHPELIRQFNQFLQVDRDKIAALKKKYGISENGGN